MLEFLLAVGVVVSLSFGILLWWETKKRIGVESLLNQTHLVLTITRTERDRLRRENARLFFLLKEKENALRKAESLLPPAARFDSLFVKPPGGDHHNE